MKTILIMGLPGSGKSTLASALKNKLMLTNVVEWFNADTVREKYNDWDFSHDGRIRQSQRMRDLADSMVDTDYVICDFVAPLIEMREILHADVVVWVDTILEGRFADTNALFIYPSNYDVRVTDKDSERWAIVIYDLITRKI